jgi:3-oxoacyl-[acyl-carrier protein] reductase
MWNLENRTAVVTGAGHGIGGATSELLASAGVRVVATDIDESAAVETCRRIEETGNVAIPFVGDLSVAASAQRMIETAVEKFGGIDIFFANAAIQMVKPAAEMTEAEWDRLMDVNLKAVFLCCRAAIPHMKAAPRQYRDCGVGPRFRNLSGVLSLCGHEGRTRSVHERARARLCGARNPRELRDPRSDRHPSLAGLL